MSGRVIDVVSEVVTPILESMAIELFAITYRKEGTNWVLSVVIDKPPEGVTINDCEKVNRALSEVLDRADPIEGAYYLEVSSPGAERKIKDYKDLQKQLGRYVYLVLKEPVEGKNKLTGYLKQADENENIILEDEADCYKLSYSQVIKARLAIKF